MRSRKQGFHIVVSKKKKNILPILKQLGPRAPSKRSGEKKMEFIDRLKCVKIKEK